MVNIGIVGTGGMAGLHAQSFNRIKGCRIAACCDIERSKAGEFASRYGVKRVYDRAEELFAEPWLDAVSIVTPDSSHKLLAMAAIRAGRHVLCEKPLALNHSDAKAMSNAASKKGVINMVNFSYRDSSALQRAAELVKEGVLGRIMHFEASYLQGWLVSKAWGDWRKSPGWLWRLSQRHGSKGVLGDVGVHIADFAGYPLGDFASVECRLKTFRKASGNRIGPYRFDANDSAVINAEMKSGAIGVIHTTRWATGMANSLKLQIHGDKGALLVDLDRSWTDLQICRGKDIDNCKWRTLKCGRTASVYERFIKSIISGTNDEPDFARGAEVQLVLDKCFESDKLGRIVRVK